MTAGGIKNRVDAQLAFRAACCVIAADGRVGTKEVAFLSEALLAFGEKFEPDRLKQPVVAACKEILKTGLAATVEAVSKELQPLVGTPSGKVIQGLCDQLAGLEEAENSKAKQIAATYSRILSVKKPSSQKVQEQPAAGNLRQAIDAAKKPWAWASWQTLGVGLVLVAMVTGQFVSFASRRRAREQTPASTAESGVIRPRAENRTTTVSGNDVAIAADGVTINGRLIPPPFSLKNISDALGAPSRTSRLQENIIHSWDNKGIIAFQPHGTDLVSTIGFLFGASGLPYAPTRLFTGAISVSGHRLQADSGVADLRAAGVSPTEPQLGMYRAELGTLSINATTRDLDAASRGDSDGLVDRLRELQVGCQLPTQEPRRNTDTLAAAAAADPVAAFKAVLALVNEQVSAPREYMKCSKGTYNQKPDFAGDDEDAGKPFEHWEKLRREIEIVGYDVAKTSSLVSPFQATLVIRSRTQSAGPGVRPRLQTEAMAMEAPYSPMTKWLKEECIYNFQEGVWVPVKDKWPFNPSKLPKEEQNGGVADSGRVVWTFKRLQ